MWIIKKWNGSGEILCQLVKWAYVKQDYGMLFASKLMSCKSIVWMYNYYRLLYLWFDTCSYSKGEIWFEGMPYNNNTVVVYIYSCLHHQCSWTNGQSRMNNHSTWNNRKKIYFMEIHNRQHKYNLYILLYVLILGKPHCTTIVEEHLQGKEEWYKEILVFKEISSMNNPNYNLCYWSWLGKLVFLLFIPQSTFDGFL